MEVVTWWLCLCNLPGNPHSQNISSRLTHDTVEHVRYRWVSEVPAWSALPGGRTSFLPPTASHKGSELVSGRSRAATWSRAQCQASGAEDGKVRASRYRVGKPRSTAGQPWGVHSCSMWLWADARVPGGQSDQEGPSFLSLIFRERKNVFFGLSFHVSSGIINPPIF